MFGAIVIFVIVMMLSVKLSSKNRDKKVIRPVCLKNRCVSPARIIKHQVLILSNQKTMPLSLKMPAGQRKVL